MAVLLLPTLHTPPRQILIGGASLMVWLTVAAAAQGEITATMHHRGAHWACSRVWLCGCAVGGADSGCLAADGMKHVSLISMVYEPRIPLWWSVKVRTHGQRLSPAFKTRREDHLLVSGFLPSVQLVASISIQY